MNIQILDDNLVKCCDINIESKSCSSEVICSESEECDDMHFFSAIEESCSLDNKVDIKIFKYIIRQKDAIIKELLKKVTILQQNVEILKNQMT